MMKKKILLMTMIAGTVMMTFSACKSKTEQAPAPAPVEQTAPVPAPAVSTAPDIAQSVVVPAFSNADVTKFCQEFKDLITEYAQYKGTGDSTKATELQTKFTNWATKAAGLAGKIKPEELQQFNDFIVSAQSKFAEMAAAPAGK